MMSKVKGHHIQRHNNLKISHWFINFEHDYILYSVCECLSYFIHNLLSRLLCFYGFR